MPDDLTLHFRRLTHAAALVAEFDGRPERQTELLAWVLEAVRAIAAARGLALETGQPEPLPPHLSRDLWPAQGAAAPDDAAWRTAAAQTWVAGGATRPALFDESEDPDLSGCAEDGAEWVPHPRTTIEAGAGFAPGELKRPEAEVREWPEWVQREFAPGELRQPDACDPTEDGAERVMQAAETWWGRR